MGVNEAPGASGLSKRRQSGELMEIWYTLKKHHSS